jgi:homoserine O-acetyltransferase
MGGWVEGEPVGDRVFLDLPAPFLLERGGVLPSVRVA